MADTNNYISKQKVEKWTTKEKFNALDLHTIETGTEYNLVGAIEEIDLGSDLKAKINGKLTAPTTPTADSAVTLLPNGTVGTKPLSEIGGGASTTQTKYQHNLVLEGTKDTYTFKAYLSVSRPDDTAFGTLDEIIAALGTVIIPCTGYVYDGTKYYSIFTLDCSGPALNYLNPDSGEQILAVMNEDVINITDDPI